MECKFLNYILMFISHCILVTYFFLLLLEGFRSLGFYYLLNLFAIFFYCKSMSSEEFSTLRSNGFILLKPTLIIDLMKLLYIERWFKCFWSSWTPWIIYLYKSVPLTWVFKKMNQQSQLWGILWGLIILLSCMFTPH